MVHYTAPEHFLQSYSIEIVFVFFWWPKAFFIFVYSVFPLGVLYPEHSHLAFDCVLIACSLESIRPGLVQGYKAPNGVG